MNSKAFLTIALSLSLFSIKAEAKGGIGSLFKLSKGARAVNGFKNYGENNLKVPELKACLKLEQDISNSNGKLKLEDGQLSKERDKLNLLKQEIDALKLRLDISKDNVFSTQGQLDSFNALADRYNNSISNYNSHISTYKLSESNFNIKVEKHGVLVTKFKNECAGKSYYIDDLSEAKESM